MLKVSDINVYYGNIHAIKDISFEVAKGEIVSLIGANGAGKSTILKTVSGLLRTKTGSITFLDGDIRTAAPNHIVKLGLAHVPEGRRIFLQMTVQENLEMGAYTQKPTALSADLENVYERFPRLRERRRQVAGCLLYTSKPLDRPSPSRSMPVSTALERVAGRPSGSIRG